MKLVQKILYILTLECKRSAELLSQAEDRKLVHYERLALRLHLLVCRYCRHYKKQFRFLKILFKRLIQHDFYRNDFMKGMSDLRKQKIKQILRNQS